MARRFLNLLLAFAAMIAAIEGIRSLVAWRDGIPPALLDLAWMACLPLVAWLWWRHVSPFGKGRGSCLSDAQNSCSTPHRPPE